MLRWLAPAALLSFTLPPAAARAAPGRVAVPIVRTALPVAPAGAPPAIGPAFSPAFDPPRALLSAVAARYGTEKDVEAVADLGEGDFGQVRSGRLPARPPAALGARLPVRPGAPVAVKIPYDDPGGMMAHEASVSRRLEDAGGGRLFVRAAHDPQLNVLVMEKLRGYRSLDEWSDGSGRLTARAAERIWAQLRRALAVLEAAGLVHSDLKPDNVLVGPGLRVKIVDFGLAADRGAYPPHPGFEEARGGHPRYTSPNQSRNGPAAFADDRHAVRLLLRRLRPRGGKAAP